MTLSVVRNLQITVSMNVDRGLLHKSSVVRIRLHTPSSRAAGEPAAVDPLLEFPSEDAPRSFFARLLRVPSLRGLTQTKGLPRPSGP